MLSDAELGVLMRTCLSLQMTNVTESLSSWHIGENGTVFCFFGIFVIFETSRDHYEIF